MDVQIIQICVLANNNMVNSLIIHGNGGDKYGA
jgi:hypothetical protein